VEGGASAGIGESVTDGTDGKVTVGGSGSQGGSKSVTLGSGLEVGGTGESAIRLPHRARA